MQKQMKINPLSLLFLSLLLILFFNNLSFHVHASSNAAAGAGAGLRFKLIHRHSPELGDQSNATTSWGVGTPKSQKERVKQLLQSDRERHLGISHKLSLSRRKNAEMKVPILEAEFPLRSGAIDLKSGQYFVSIRVGSPPRKFLLMADTGSTLTWMKCKYKCENGCSNGDKELEGRIYYPNNSRTFRPIPCSSPHCSVGLSSFISAPDYCHQPTLPCAYDYRYNGKVTVMGTYGTDTVKYRLRDGRKIKMTDVVIGCSEKILGSEDDFAYTDGILGLGYNMYNSFAVAAAKMFGDRFSYCLVDHMSHTNVVNFLHFGYIKNPQPTNMQYTSLDFESIDTYYLITVSGISIDGKMLDIPPNVWDVKAGFGFMLDCGSSLTYLLKPAYDPVIAALEPSIRKFKKINVREGLEYCFDTTTGYTEASVPKLEIHFADGAKFSPPVKSYIIDYEPGVKCIGFISTASHETGINILGNIMQQNHLWEFDLLNSKLGFAPSSCIID